MYGKFSGYQQRMLIGNSNNFSILIFMHTHCYTFTLLKLLSIKLLRGPFVFSYIVTFQHLMSKMIPETLNAVL